MGNIKEINVKNRTYYFLMIWLITQIFIQTYLKIDKKLYKNIDIYYIEYITMKDSEYVKMNSINNLYLIIDEVDGHFEEKKWK